MPPAEEFGWLGWKPDQFESPPVVVWPDNRTAVSVFLAMRTQWRVGMNGFTGLDYCALAEVWRRLKVPPDDRDDVFHGLQVIEQAALSAMHKRN